MPDRPEIKEWKDRHGKDLNIGTEVKILPSCPYYDPQFDHGTYMVVSLYLDSGGLNIGLNEGGGPDDWNCGTDGYRAEHLGPAE